MANRVPNFLSLFSGCGGFDLGFQNVGFECAGAFDIDKTVLAVHQANLRAETFQVDLSRQEIPEIKGFDVLISGSPCQGFSTIGKRKLDDPRNSLLLVAGRVAARLKPKFFVAENVPAVASGSHRKYWTELNQLLHDAGYQTQELLCDASKYGTPQKRKRLFLVAWRTKQKIDFALTERNGGVLADALANVAGLPNHQPVAPDPDSTDFKIAKRIQAGQKLSNVRMGNSAVHTWDIPEVFGRTNKKERAALEQIIFLRRRNRIRDHGDADPVKTTLLKKLFGLELLKSLEAKGFLRKLGGCHDLTGTFNGKFRRQRLDAPSCTVDTRFGNPRYFLHPIEHRGYSVREAARIQGFPDDFVFSGTLSEQFTMVGNAVPPPLARTIAQLIWDALSVQ